MITQRLFCNASSSIKTLEEYTWEEISAIGQAGKGADYFNIGDTKTIQLNGIVGTVDVTGTYKVFIIEFNYRGDNGIYFQGFKNLNDTDIALCDWSDNNYNGGNNNNGLKKFNLNHWGDYNYGGWKGCDLRYDILGSTSTQPSGYGAAKTTSCVGYDATTSAKTSPVNNTLMAALPSTLRNVLEPWTVYTDNTGNSSSIEANITSSIDYLTFLSAFEVSGSTAQSNSYEQNYQSQMTYYKINSSSKNKRKYHSSINDCRVNWHLRSPAYNNTYAFCYMFYSGAVSYASANQVRGLAPAFRV